MKLGSKTDLFYPYGKDMYKKMKEYGFDYADIPISGILDGKTEEEYLSEVMKQKRMADAAGVTIWQVHGPWRYPPHDEKKSNQYFHIKKSRAHHLGKT